jgi:hypothetical protein
MQIWPLTPARLVYGLDGRFAVSYKLAIGT